MKTFTQKLKTTLLAVMTFCMACSATACDLAQFLPLNQSSSSASNESIESPYPDSIEDSSSESVDSSSDEDETAKEQARAKEIMDQAFALSVGETLQGTYHLSGVVSHIDVDYTENRGVCLYMNVNEPLSRELYCYRLNGEGAELITVGTTVTVSGTIKNYKGLIEFDNPTLLSYLLTDGSQRGTDTPNPTNDPYKDVSWNEFYANYSPATSNEDAYYRSLHGFLSGDLTVR